MPPWSSARVIAVIFGVVLLVSAYLSGRTQREQPTADRMRLAAIAALELEAIPRPKGRGVSACAMCPPASA